jgi:hypothetical protein
MVLPSLFTYIKEKENVDTTIIFKSFNNSNEAISLTGASSTNDLYNDKFDFKFQVPKILK